MSFRLTISERGNSWAGRGAVSTEHETREAAEAGLAEYVRRNWAAEMDEEAPADDKEMIDRYFADVLESYEIEATEAEAPSKDRRRPQSPGSGSNAAP